MTTQHLSLLTLAAAAAILAGCASSGVKNPSGVHVTEMRPDERGFVAGTGVESQDIVAVCDKMARGLLGLERINTAKTRKHGRYDRKPCDVVLTRKQR